MLGYHTCATIAPSAARTHAPHPPSMPPLLTSHAGGQPEVCGRGAGQLHAERHHVDPGRVAEAGPDGAGGQLSCLLVRLPPPPALPRSQSQQAAVPGLRMPLLRAQPPVAQHAKLACTRKQHVMRAATQCKPSLTPATACAWLHSGLPPHGAALAAQGRHAQNEGRLLPAHAFPLIW